MNNKIACNKLINNIRELQLQSTAMNYLIKTLNELLEVILDLRCYVHDWDWKYGDYWDDEIKKAEEIIKAFDELKRENEQGTTYE